MDSCIDSLSIKDILNRAVHEYNSSTCSNNSKEMPANYYDCSGEISVITAPTYNKHNIITSTDTIKECKTVMSEQYGDRSWSSPLCIRIPAHYDCKCGDTDGDKKIDDESEEIDLTIDYILYNDPATIVFWSDGTKTVVKCAPGQKFNKYFGFCAAVTKRVFGTNSLVNRIVESGTDAKPKKSTVKAKNSSKKATKSRKNAEKELEND